VKLTLRPSLEVDLMSQLLLPMLVISPLTVCPGPTSRSFVKNPPPPPTYHEAKLHD
jgi:hypothetical protein